MERVLVIEDNRAMREMLQCVIAEKGYEVEAVADAESAWPLLQRGHLDLVLSDLQLPGMDGLTLFKRSRETGVPFIILTAHGSIEKAVEAIKEGAFDFIAKPVDPDYLLLMIGKALDATRVRRENVVLREELEARRGQPVIIGQSAVIRQAAEQLRRVADTTAAVLLLGESGTGKELFARALHGLSPRRPGPFIAVNASSIPETLLENELFGHEKGAYTGAHGRQEGKLELARGGTFFFDEIGDLPQGLQGKLLRVLEEKAVRRLGGSLEIRLDVRFVFATNQDLEKACTEGRFRRDLFFRISMFPITLPPLRERPEDVRLLADHFCRRYAAELGKGPLTLSEAARQRLLDYAWPGNVRELQNAVERAVIISRGRDIAPGDIVLPDKPFPLPDEPFSWQGSLKEVTARAVRLVERVMIGRALELSGGHRTRAARALGISYRALLDKIKGIEREGRGLRG